MSTIERYPLDETHLEALRWACVHPDAAQHLDRLGLDASLEAVAVEHLSSPASAASLTRDLLARAGVPEDMMVGVFWCSESGVETERGIVFAENYAAVQEARSLNIETSDVPRLISSLAGLAPGDREGAMRALREVGR